MLNFSICSTRSLPQQQLNTISKETWTRNLSSQNNENFNTSTFLWKPSRAATQFTLWWNCWPMLSLISTILPYGDQRPSPALTFFLLPLHRAWCNLEWSYWINCKILPLAWSTTTIVSRIPTERPRVKCSAGFSNPVPSAVVPDLLLLTP